MEIELPQLDLAPEFRPAVDRLAGVWAFKTRVDILIVVENDIATVPGVGFGVGTVIELIRSSVVGCMRFRVDIALRNGDAQQVVPAPGDYEPRYRGFRFDMQNGASDVIDKYEQIWCFGFRPGNSGSGNDADIDQASQRPSSDAELAKLASWMNEKQGGLFATGDHHFLGASMCRRIPRVGLMRRWTNGDGVPPIGTPDRIDTLRPPGLAFMPGAPGGPADLINTPHQGDDTPQQIQWTSWSKTHWPFVWKKRPHPVLCHPTLGPIDVMPDHAHEGLCVETADIDAAATYNFGGGNQPEFPAATAGGPKPLPRIIAYGSTLGDPPFNFYKGSQPARAKFPMISVYDGHQAGVGRVASDSTWHHWFDVNLTTFKNANDDNWKKISRYFINLAVWLNPPAYSTNCLWLSATVSHFQYPGFEEFDGKLSTIDLGRVLHGHLSRSYGPCWVTERIWWDIVWIQHLWPWEELMKIETSDGFPGVDPTLLEYAYLGALVEASRASANKAKEAIFSGKKEVDIALTDPEKRFRKQTSSRIKELAKEIAQRSRKTADFMERAGS